MNICDFDRSTGSTGFVRIGIFDGRINKVVCLRDQKVSGYGIFIVNIFPARQIRKSYTYTRNPKIRKVKELTSIPEMRSNSGILIIE
jgi:hypothetical protein